MAEPNWFSATQRDVRFLLVADSKNKQNGRRGLARAQRQQQKHPPQADERPSCRVWRPRLSDSLPPWPSRRFPLSVSLFSALRFFYGGGTISFLRHYPPSPPPPTITAPTTHHKKRMPPCFLSPYKPPPTKQGTHAWPGHSRREAAACHFAFSTPHHTDTLVTAPCTHSSLAPFQHTHTSQQPHNSAPCGFLTRAQQANSTLHF